ncbi:MAG TPA: hypothetical protein VK659_04505 [Asanoa sp.]|nr:hypothetical protein [Asanoa sp.]
MSDALTEVLLAALLDVVASLELSADDLVDPGFVADAFDDVTGQLDALTDADRALLVTLIRAPAATEPNADRRSVLAGAPEHFGLLED